MNQLLLTLSILFYVICMHYDTDKTNHIFIDNVDLDDDDTDTHRHGIPTRSPLVN